MASPVVDGATALGYRVQQFLRLLTRPLIALTRRLPTRRAVALRNRIAGLLGGLPTWAGYLLAVAAGTLLMLLRQIDSALRQMHLVGEPGDGALKFPYRLSAADAVSAVREQRTAWERYVEEIPDTRPVAAPGTLINHLAVLDVLFVAVYAVLLATVILHLVRLNDRLVTDPFTAARRRTLIGAGFALGALVVIDLVEDALLWLAFGHGQDWAVALGPVPIGPLASILTIMLAALIAISVMITCSALLLAAVSARRALMSARGVLIEVGLVVVVLLFVGMGAEQADDVVRAWTPVQALATLVAGIVAALTAVGVITHLTSRARENPRPDHGDRDPQPLVLGLSITLLALGGLTKALGAGWGLMVPGALLFLLWALGLPMAGVRQPAPDAEPANHTAQVAGAGARLARMVGAGLLATLVWVIARASAFDLFVRAAPPRLGWIASALFVVLALMAVGGWIAVRGVHWRTSWRWLTLAGLGLCTLTLVPALEVALPATIGSIAVLLAFLTVLVGVTGVAVGVVRLAPIGRFRLVPALRVVGFRRFPVVIFLLVWVVVLGRIDPGGYHDIRRTGPEDGAAPPTLQEAFQSWRSADPDATARPLVIVAAQGGGIRAAVWTALVMECLFGPGPVVTDADCAGGNTGELDRARAAALMRDEPLPVFLASGASGGSVGLAAWSARRVDLANAGSPAATGTPKTIEDALGDDFLAPNLARWFIGDLSYAFLAHSMADRAAVMEQAWEQPWAGPGTGLNRGLRASWDEANGDDDWRIPVLALNGVGVEDGCRFLASPVDFSIANSGGDVAADGTMDEPTDAGCRTPRSTGDMLDALPVTGELVDYLCPGQDVPLSTAAHLSARFPYISPTGRIERTGCPAERGLVEDRAVTFDADGGLFDNSGALTALEAWRALAPIAVAEERPDSCVVPIFVQIDNGVGTAAGTGPDQRPAELVAPANALLGEVESRQTHARNSAATAFSPPVSPGGREVTVNGAQPDRLWFHISLFGQPGPEPPLGWTLAESTVGDMRAQLGAGPNQTEIATLRHLLTAQLACT